MRIQAIDIDLGESALPTYQVRIRNLQTRQETVTLQVASSPEQAAAAVRHLGKVIEVKLSETPPLPASPTGSVKTGATPPPPTNPAAQALSAIQKLTGSSSPRPTTADQIDGEIRRVRLKATYRPLPILLGLIACMLIIASGVWWWLMIRDLFELAPDNLQHEIHSIESSLLKALIALGSSIVLLSLRSMLIHVTITAMLQKQIFRRQATRAAASQR